VPEGWGSRILVAFFFKTGALAKISCSQIKVIFLSRVRFSLPLRHFCAALLESGTHYFRLFDPRRVYQQVRCKDKGQLPPHTLPPLTGYQRQVCSHWAGGNADSGRDHLCLADAESELHLLK